jgi:prolyl oligopeptidase
MFGIDITEDGKYALLETRKDCDDLGLVAYADISGNPLTGKVEFTPIIKEWIGGFNLMYNIGSIFYFKTNYKAPKSKVISINIENPAEENWVDVIPEHE